MDRDKKKSEQTRERIYSIAIRLFQTEGYDETTMRRIASESETALGSTYYHFKNKEEIVLMFYKQSQKDIKLQSNKFNESTPDFKLRLKNILLYRLESFAKYKKFLSVLARNAGDPNHPLSPFSVETKEIREEAIGMIRDALATSKLKLKGELLYLLPELLWLYQMGIIYFWISDTSKSYEKTKLLISESLDLIFKLIKISSFPFFKNILGPMFRIYKVVKTI
ncbi:MAG: TetR family transcriptional regulator [Leptospira sp.]|nr:TetR family transcriptional regulator [Leptospira sp.]